MTNTPTDPVEAVAEVVNSFRVRQIGPRHYEVVASTGKHEGPYGSYDAAAQKARIYAARAAIRAYREALEASGWQVVPREESPGMVKKRIQIANHYDIRSQVARNALSALWPAMLSTAPTPEDRDDD